MCGSYTNTLPGIACRAFSIPLGHFPCLTRLPPHATFTPRTTHALRHFGLFPNTASQTCIHADRVPTCRRHRPPTYAVTAYDACYPCFFAFVTALVLCRIFRSDGDDVNRLLGLDALWRTIPLYAAIPLSRGYAFTGCRYL